MKYKIAKIATGFLTLFLFFSFTISCDNDDDSGNGGNFNVTELRAMIDQAQTLLGNTEEGTMAGDQQPGSKATLQSVIAAIEKLIIASESQADIDDAGLKMEAAIQTYIESVVATAIPWVKQGPNGTGIRLSDNIKPILFGASTIEVQVYIVDLNQSGFSNNLFSIENFPARGFGVRYFANGLIEVVSGIGEAWPTNSAPEGTMTAGEWIDVAYTNTGSAQKLYINGELVAALDGTTPVTTDVPFYLGNSPVFNDRIVNALYREFKVWNSALDQATIQNNIGSTVEGTEAGLEAYFPFSSDLGSSFEDVTGKYTATLEGDVTWEEGPPVIILDYTNLDTAIQEITDFKATIVEGDQDGDFPIGTVAFIDTLIANANDVRANEGRQTALDDAASALTTSIALINSNLVGPSEGIYIDSEDPNAVGLRMTPNYTPTGDYTYELDLKLRTLLLPNGAFGDIFGNNTMGLRVNGYLELTEENLLNAGGGWNFTFLEDIGNYSGPMFPPLTIKSGIWQHVAIVHDNTALTTSIYVDGEMVAQQTDIGVPLQSAWAETWLGNAFGFKINGDIKDFRIWDEIRLPSQLNMEINGNEPNLRTYFPLDRVKGIFFKDETGNYNGEMRGVLWNK